MKIVNRKSKIVNGSWLPDMDLNHDKQIQSLLCYRYTIGQTGAMGKLDGFMDQSSCQTRLPSSGRRCGTPSFALALLGLVFCLASTPGHAAETNTVPNAVQ